MKTLPVSLDENPIRQDGKDRETKQQVRILPLCGSKRKEKMMWITRSALKKLETENNELEAEKRRLTEEVETLKFKKRLEQEEIVHLQRINEEKLKQEVQQEKIDLQKLQQEAITGFKKEQTEKLLALTQNLHEKMESRFNTELGNLKEIYQALMARLPNVNLHLEKKIK